MIDDRLGDEFAMDEITFEDVNKFEGQAYEFIVEFYDSKFECSECEESFIVNDEKEGKMVYYSHPQGLKNNKENRYWIYIECPNCHYQHSFEKIIYNSDFSLNKKK